MRSRDAAQFVAATGASPCADAADCEWPRSGWWPRKCCPGMPPQKAPLSAGPTPGALAASARRCSTIPWQSAGRSRAHPHGVLQEEGVAKRRALSAQPQPLTCSCEFPRSLTRHGRDGGSKSIPKARRGLPVEYSSGEIDIRDDVHDFAAPRLDTAGNRLLDTGDCLQ